jgi:uncharacterized protein (DUF1015 family)
MEPSSPVTPRFTLRPFRALRVADSLVGAPMANRIFARPYRSVPGRLRDWRHKHHLRVDLEPGVYLHEYTSTGLTVRGLVATLDLVPAADSVFPHEGVHESQVEQLAARMHQMLINPAPILLTHTGPEEVRQRLAALAATEPQVVSTDRTGQRHRVWRVTGADEIDRLTALLEGTQAVIADGHHRYAAARRLQVEHPGTGWERTLVMLVDQADTPLQLGAVHRSVPGVTLEAVERVARQRGHAFERLPDRASALNRLEHCLILHDGTGWAAIGSGKPGIAVCDLHVELLPTWGLDDSRVSYHHSASTALAAAGGGGLAVLLPSPTFEQVADSARSGRLLPQKATSFQPKPHLGVLMRDLRDE